MPNRILRDWTDSDRVNSLSAEGERLFTRLIMKADDYGRYFADAKRLKAFLFPLSDQVRETDVARWLAECERAGLVRFYDAAGKRYLELLNFGQRLRNMRNIHPTPEGTVPAEKSSPADNPPLVAAARGDSRPESEVESESESETETEGKGNVPPRATFAEIPPVEQAIAQSATAGIPPDFVRYVYADWSSRQGKDAAGNPVPWLPYITKRLAAGTGGMACRHASRPQSRPGGHAFTPPARRAHRGRSADLRPRKMG